MRGSKHGSYRRRRRVLGTSTTLVGLIMSLFLALGQFGLASAGGWNDRSGGSGSEGPTGGAGGGSGKATVVRTSELLAAAVPAPGAALDLEGWRPAPVNDWTDGNVCGSVPAGQCYRELDNVPHRILFRGLTVGTEYYFDVNIEFLDGTIEGYDDLRNVDGYAGVSAISSAQRPNVTCGSKTCKQFRITFTPSASGGEIRFDVRLAIGAHLWSGSNLSTQLAGIGGETVTIPVREIVFEVVAHKFNDLNGDGDQDLNEPDLAGWTMTVYQGQSCSGSPVTSGTTGDNGNVTFHLTGADADRDGYVSVAETLQAGWVATTPTCQATRGGTLNFGNRQLLPNLTISKEGPETVELGGEVEYTITVTNTGEGATPQGVTITDDVPSQLSGVSATYSKNVGAPQTCTVDGNAVTCNVGVLNPRDSVVVTITGTAPSERCPTFENTAYVAIGTQTPQPSNTVATEVTGCAPEVTISKTGPQTVGLGDPFTYSITVANVGTATTDGDVTVTDQVPSELSVVAAVFSIGGGDVQDCEVSGNDVTCDVGTLDPGDEVLITITATAPQDSCPTVENRAFVGELGSNTVTTEVTGCQPPPPPAGIQIVKGGPTLAHRGDTITYTFDVKLTAGSVSLTNVTVTDPICDTGTLSAPTGDDGDGVLEQGETWSYTCTHVVTETDPDPLPNTATATGRSGNTTVSDQDSHVVDLIHPAIQIVKTANPRSGAPGETITYTYEVTNTGDVTLTDISVDDDKLGHICDIASLDPGDSETCTASFRIPTGTNPPFIRNVGTAVGTDPLGETVRDDDPATIDVVLGQTVTPTPTKTPPGGTSFTGAAAAIPLAGLALLFLTLGSGLLWIGGRRGRHVARR